MLDVLLSTFAEMAWLEFLGLVSGIGCVWLLIRRNVWTFPIGLIYALVSVVVFTRTRLYADVLLSGYYVVMNGYGWYYWLYGGNRGAAGTLPVTRIPGAQAAGLAVATVTSTVLMGWFFATQTNAALPYWDSLTTCMSFTGMWMTARKYVENWMVWLVVDIVAAVIYLVKGIEFYALLYGIYLVMAVFGWRAWQRSMVVQPAMQSA